MVVMSQRLLWNEPMMMNNHNGYKLSLSSKTSSLSGTIWWGGCLQSVFYLYLYISVFVFVCLYIYIYIWICLCVTHYCQDLHVPVGSADCVCSLRVCSLLRESKGFCHTTLGKALLFRDGWAISTFFSCQEHTIFFGWKSLKVGKLVGMYFSKV